MKLSNRTFKKFLDQYTLIDNNFFEYINDLSHDEIKVYLFLQQLISDEDFNEYTNLEKNENNIPFKLSMKLNDMTEKDIIVILKNLADKKLISFNINTKNVKILIPDCSYEKSNVTQKYTSLHQSLIELTENEFDQKSLRNIIITANDFAISENGVLLITKYLKDLGFGAEKSSKRIIDNIQKFANQGYISDNEIEQEINRRSVFAISGIVDIKKALNLTSIATEQEIEYVVSWQKLGFKLLSIRKIIECKYYFINSMKRLDTVINDIYYEFIQSNDSEIINDEYIEQNINLKNTACEIVNKILYKFNIGVSNKNQYNDKILSYLKLGFTKESLIKISELLENSNFKTFKAYIEEVDKFIENKIINFEDVKNEISRQNKFNKNLLNLLRAAGSSKQTPSENDKIFYSKWINEYHLDNEFILKVIKAIYMNYLNMARLDEVILKVKNNGLKSVEEIRKFLNIKKTVEENQDDENLENFEDFKINGEIIQ